MNIKDNALVKYFVGSFEEFNKVTWPTKNQAIKLTGIVLGFTLASAGLIAAVDYIFQLGFLEATNYFINNFSK